MKEMNANEYQLNASRRDLVSFILISSLNSKLKSMKKNLDYMKYESEEGYLIHPHTLDSFILSGCIPDNLTSFLILKKAMKAWTAIPANDRLHVMLTFRDHMAEIYPHKKRHFKTMVFCRVFLHELLPILSTGNN